MSINLDRRSLVTGALAGGLAGCAPRTIGTAMNVLDGVATRAPTSIGPFKEFARFNHGNQGARSLSLSPDRRYLAIATHGDEGYWCVYDVRSGRQILKRPGRGSVTFTPEGEHLITSITWLSRQTFETDSARVSVFRVGDWTVEQELVESEKGAAYKSGDPLRAGFRLQFAGPNNEYIFAGGARLYDRSFRPISENWSFEREKPEPVEPMIDPHRFISSGANVSPDGATFLIFGYDVGDQGLGKPTREGIIELRSTSDGRLLKRLNPGHLSGNGAMEIKTAEFIESNPNKILVVGKSLFGDRRYLSFNPEESRPIIMIDLTTNEVGAFYWPVLGISTGNTNIVSYSSFHNLLIADGLSVDENNNNRYYVWSIDYYGKIAIRLFERPRHADIYSTFNRSGDVFLLNFRSEVALYQMGA